MLGDYILRLWCCALRPGVAGSLSPPFCSLSFAPWVHVYPPLRCFVLECRCGSQAACVPSCSASCLCFCLFLLLGCFCLSLVAALFLAFVLLLLVLVVCVVCCLSLCWSCVFVLWFLCVWVLWLVGGVAGSLSPLAFVLFFALVFCFLGSLFRFFVFASALL